MRIRLTRGLQMALLLLMVTACESSEGVRKIEPVVGDVEPFELRPTSIFIEPDSSVSRGVDRLSGDRVFVPSRFGEARVSAAMTHWLAPGRLNGSFGLELGAAEGRVVRVCIFSEPELEAALFKGFSITDKLGKTVATETTDYLNEGHAGAPSEYPQRDFLVDETFFERLGGSERTVVDLRFPPAAKDYLIRVSVFEPASTLSLGAAVEAQTYQPGDTVKVAFELFDERSPETEIDRIEMQLEIGQVNIESPGEVLMDGARRGVAHITIPALEESGRARLNLITHGRTAGQSFRRSTRVHFDVVRPHAEIFDLRQRMGKGAQGPQFEVDVTVRSVNADRFRVFAVLTGRAQSGYEIPVARAQATLDGVENGLSTTTLVFSLAAVRESVLVGPFLLRDVVLRSMYTGAIQHRIGLVDGVETPLRWGLAGNRALNDAMCEILAEAGRLPRGECGSD